MEMNFTLKFSLNCVGYVLSMRTTEKGILRQVHVLTQTPTLDSQAAFEFIQSVVYVLLCNALSWCT